MTITKSNKVSELFEVDSNMGQLIQKAAAIQSEYKRLEAELKEIRKITTAYIVENNVDQLKSGDFTISRLERGNWTYSERIQNELKKLDDDKKWEIAKGIATNDPTISCTIRTNKK